MRGVFGVAFMLSAVAACGSNTPEIPPELLVSDPAQGSSYPAGPYGAEIGDTVRDLEFSGWRRPREVARTEDTTERIALSDFYDPADTKGIRLILINTAAIWCGACQVEHRTLPEKNDEFRRRGLVILSTLFQDAERRPARFVHLSQWVETFDPNYAMLLDPEYQMGVFASAETAPLNLVVDARTMRVKQKFIGDQAAVIWPYIDAELK
jgi:hypothetical protein